jgi:hypothetical protein
MVQQFSKYILDPFLNNWREKQNILLFSLFLKKQSLKEK